MMEDNLTERESFGAGCTYVILRESFEHGVFGELSECGKRTDAEGESRKDEVFEVEVLT